MHYPELELDAIQVNNLLWSYAATQGITSAKVVEYIDRNFNKIDASVVELSSILWSICVAGRTKEFQG